MTRAEEILDNIITIADTLGRQDASAPDLPYIELAKGMKVTEAPLTAQRDLAVFLEEKGVDHLLRQLFL